MRRNLLKSELQLGQLYMIYFVVLFIFLIGFFSVINQLCIRFNPKLLGRPLVARWRKSESLFRKRFLSSLLVVLIIDSNICLKK